MNTTASPRRQGAGILAVPVLLAYCLASPAFAQHAPPAEMRPDGALYRLQQQDTSTVRSRLPEGHSPRGALWRAAVLPGWGQAYNRQYLKIPIVYAGLGGVAGLALFANYRYLIFRHAYLYTVRTADFPHYQSDYIRARSLLGLPGEGLSEAERQRVSSTLRGNRDILRRNRDLLYIGIGLFYGLTVLDAYVNAHLLDFDVGEDLTLSFHPMPAGLAASVRFGR